MKPLIILLSLLFSANAFAHQIDSSFIELQARHKVMVNNDGESWIAVSTMAHEEEGTSLGQVVAEILKDDSYYLEGMEMVRISEEETKVKGTVIKHLLNGYHPYFCSTFYPADNDDIWNDDTEFCSKKLNELFGDALIKADVVAILDMYGNYYGDWGKSIVILQNEDTKESLMIEFDMIHEI